MSAMGQKEKYSDLFPDDRFPRRSGLWTTPIRLVSD